MVNRVVRVVEAKLSETMALTARIFQARVSLLPFALTGSAIVTVLLTSIREVYTICLKLLTQD